MSHDPPNARSSMPERHTQAKKIRAWIGAIGGILNDAQVYKVPRLALGSGADELRKEAAVLWPDQAWESNDPPGPPSAHRIDVKVESIPKATQSGTQPVALEVSVERRSLGDPVVTFTIPLAAAAPLQRALEEHRLFWELDAEAGNS